MASVPFPEVDRPYYEALGVEVIGSTRRRLITATWQIGRLLVWRALAPLLGTAANIIVPDRDIRTFREADLVIDLSGDMLTDDYGPHVAYSHFLPLVMALLCKTPIAIVAQSIGPFGFSRPMAKAVLSRAAIVTIRDPVTRGYLDALGVEVTEMTADLAFRLAPATPEEVGRAVPQQDWPNGGVLGVSVSGLAAAHFAKTNPAFGSRTYAEVMADALDEVVSRHALGIVFFPHVTGPGPEKDDRRIAAEIGALMTADSTRVEADLAPADLKALIGRTRIFLGARMHANIAALSSNVPTVAMAYSHKTHGIMELLELGDHVVDVSSMDASTLTVAVDRLLAQESSVRVKLAERVPLLADMAGRNIDLIMAELRSTPEG